MTADQFNVHAPRYSTSRLRQEIKSAQIRGIVRCLDAYVELGGSDSADAARLVQRMREIIEEIKRDT